MLRIFTGGLGVLLLGCGLLVPAKADDKGIKQICAPYIEKLRNYNWAIDVKNDHISNQDKLISSQEETIDLLKSIILSHEERAKIADSIIEQLKNSN